MNRSEAMERIERIRTAVRNGQTARAPRGPVDPKDVAEFEAEVVRGRDRGSWDRWRSVMEFHGFRWFEPQQLNEHPAIGPKKVIPKEFRDHGQNLWWYQPHLEGQWRRTQEGARTAETFTQRDLVQLFVNPEAFDRWIREKDLRSQAASVGLVLPKNLRL